MSGPVSYTPAPFVSSERSVFLSMSLMVTDTPGITAPVGSVTLPVTSAELVAWLHAMPEYTQRMPLYKASPLHREDLFIVPLLESGFNSIQVFETMSSDRSI